MKNIFFRIFIVILLAAGIWAYTNHEKRILAEKQAAEWRERLAGYERCVASLDENHIGVHDPEGIAVWLKARQGCREFWFQVSPKEK
jgi:hypothetical protein